MRVRSFVKLFIPPIIMEMFYTLRDRFTKIEDNPLPQIEHGSKEFIVIGNGPSFKETLARYQDKMLGKDMVVVNSFASTEAYELLKPSFYLMTDPIFYSIPEYCKNTIWNDINNICEKTMWPMYVILLSWGKGRPIAEALSRNKNIQVVFLQNNHIIPNKMSQYEAWDKNFTVPHGQTVLNTALYLGLYWNYKEIYLIGADSSFFEDIRIDQNTNEIWTIDSHFFDNNKIYKDKGFFDKSKGLLRDDIALHELIFRYGRMFEDYYELEKYAQYKGAKVYNASEYSWINVFERKKL